MLKKYIQVLLRLLNSYISNIKNFFVSLVTVLKLLFKWYSVNPILKPEEFVHRSKDDPICALIGMEPKIICPKNIVVTYPSKEIRDMWKGRSPEIIFGLRLFNDLEGKTVHIAYKELLAAILVNVQNHTDSDLKPFLFSYCFSNAYENLNKEATFLYFDNKVYYVNHHVHTEYIDTDDAFGLVMGEFINPDHPISIGLISEERLTFHF